MYICCAACQKAINTNNKFTYLLLAQDLYEPVSSLSSCLFPFSYIPYLCCKSDGKITIPHTFYLLSIQQESKDTLCIFHARLLSGLWISSHGPMTSAISPLLPSFVCPLPPILYYIYYSCTLRSIPHTDGTPH